MELESTSFFVGGEFYDDPGWFLDEPALPVENAYFLNGGRASLAVISDYLLDHGIHRILLPAYLCPSILDVFQQHRLEWDFYRINQDLSIDLTDLKEKVKNTQAIYFINYFGFPHPPQTLAALKDLQKSGKLLVEDNAQAGFPDHTIGDFTFNSIRKLAPFDGGYLYSNLDIHLYIHCCDFSSNRRLPLIRAYRRELRKYLLEGQGSYRRLISLHARAERFYEDDPVLIGDPMEQELIERQDWQGMSRKRRENYNYLLEHILEIPEIKPLFPVLKKDASPLGLPIYIDAVARDELYDYLGENSIGLFIHWQEILDDSRLTCLPEANDMAGRMLTLTCDQRTSRRQLDYLVHHLKKGITLLKS
jgi:dTDP-4-amino-4,6-dideoxygalactose transaminase